MPALTVELHVHAADRRFVTPAALAHDAALRQTLATEINDDSSGGLAITDDVEMVLVDDLLMDVAGFFFDELPDLLQEGRGGTYKFRTGPETTSIEPQGASVLITGYDGTRLETSTAQLLDCLKRAQQDYAALEQLIAKV